MKIFTVTVNYNCAGLLERHLASLRAQSPEVESIIVDNASDDDSVRTIRDNFPDIRVIEAGHNAGYGTGANIGIKEAARQGADFVLVLNPDVFLEPDYIQTLLSHMQDSPNTAVCSGRLYRDTTNGQKILDSTGLFLRWDFFARDRDAGKPDTGQNGETEKVFALCGAALFLRMSAFKNTAEIFDEDIFMYGEDIDLCWRARRSGSDVVYVPGARAVHARGGSGAQHRFRLQNTRLKEQTLMSRYIYLINNLRPTPLTLLRLIAAETEILALMILNPKLFAVYADIWKMRRKLPVKKQES